MFATVALAATSAPPMTTFFVLVEGAESWTPLLSIGSTLFVVSWSNEVAVVVIAKVLKFATGNEGRPVSDTIRAISLDSTLTPESV